jgi:hypothetical protein
VYGVHFVLGERPIGGPICQTAGHRFAIFWDFLAGRIDKKIKDLNIRQEWFVPRMQRLQHLGKF